MLYEGLSVLTMDPNRRDEPTHTATRSKTRIDSITGPFTEVVHGPAERQTRPFSWFMRNRAAIDEFRTFRDSCRGRAVPFWVPTWQNDLRLAADVNAGDVTITTLNVAYTRYMFDPVATWRRHVAFILIGVGVQFIRRIDSAVESVSTESLGLDSAIVSALDRRSWMLSFVSLARFAADRTLLHWHSDRTAEAEFDIVELPAEMPLVPTT